MNTRAVNYQKTTSKRSLCNVAQKYLCFKNYEEYLEFIRKNTIGVCPNTGNSFGDVIDNVVVRGMKKIEFRMQMVNSE